MPLFDYQCKACGHTFEALVSKSKFAPQTCPKCGAKQLEKQLSRFSVGSDSSGSSASVPSCSTGTCPFAQN